MLTTKLATFRGYIAVVKPQGRLVLGATEKFRTAMAAAIGNDYRRIVIDLGQVNKIDCAGLGELVRFYVQARDAGAWLALTNVTRRVRDLLVITKLITVFPIIVDDVISNDEPSNRTPANQAFEFPVWQRQDVQNGNHYISL